MSEHLRRAVNLLDQLARTETQLSIRGLAEATGLSKSAVQRTLAGLVETGLAEQHSGTGRYALGPRTLALGMAYRRRVDLRTIALPVMARLRDESGETVGLSVPVGDEVIHVEQVVSRSELRRVFEIGRPLPLWCGAPSRLLLVDRDPDDVRRLVHERESATIVPADPPTPENLLVAIERCREQGFALAIGETIAGVNTVAAPIRDAERRVHATLSVTGPASRWREREMRACLPALSAAAEEVSARLGAA